jgi:hypothetical protein
LLWITRLEGRGWFHELCPVFWGQVLGVNEDKNSCCIFSTTQSI